MFSTLVPIVYIYLLYRIVSKPLLKNLTKHKIETNLWMLDF